MYQKYWERIGSRRPLPALWEARKAYGKESADFPAPEYVERGKCKWCGKSLEGTRRKSFCSNECSKKYNDLTVWGRGRSAYGYRILCRDNFTCQDCGRFLAYKNEFDIYIPVEDRSNAVGLEVHHIVPVSEGGGDEPSNLVTLCSECHRERHKNSRLYFKNIE